MLHIKGRLEGDEENRELEALVGHALAYSKAIALEMFRCGREFQKQLDNA